MNKKLLVTTSWDDGHKLDIRLAALLKKYGIKGTFYICPQDHEFKNEDLLSTQDILTISKDFEIGGHTITHPYLTKITIAQIFPPGTRLLRLKPSPPRCEHRMSPDVL